MELTLWKTKKTRITLAIGHKGKTFKQIHIISLYKEFLDNEGNTEFAKELFTI